MQFRFKNNGFLHIKKVGPVYLVEATNAKGRPLPKKLVSKQGIETIANLVKIYGIQLDFQKTDKSLNRVTYKKDKSLQERLKRAPHTKSLEIAVLIFTRVVTIEFLGPRGGWGGRNFLSSNSPQELLTLSALIEDFMKSTK